MNTRTAVSAEKLTAAERAAFARRAALCQESADSTPEDCWHQHAWHLKAARRWARVATWDAVNNWSDEDKLRAVTLAARANDDTYAVFKLALQLLQAGTPAGDCLPCARAIVGGTQ